MNRTPASPELAGKYAEKRQSQIVADIGEIEKLGVRPVLGDYLIEELHATEGLIARHETLRVAHDLLRLVSESREAALVIRADRF